MSADTQQIVRATAPLNGIPYGHSRAGAFWNRGPDRAADDRPVIKAHPAPPGVDGHWLGDGAESWWNPFDEEVSR